MPVLVRECTRLRGEWNCAIYVVYVWMSQPGGYTGPRRYRIRDPQGNKRERCANAVQEAKNAIAAIERRQRGAISAGGLNAGHQKAISQSLTQLKNAVKDIIHNCFDNDDPSGPPLFPEFTESIRTAIKEADEFKVPSIGWDGGRTQAENRIKTAAVVSTIGAVITEAGVWLWTWAWAH